MFHPLPVVNRNSPAVQPMHIVVIRDPVAIRSSNHRAVHTVRPDRHNNNNSPANRHRSPLNRSHRSSSPAV